MNFVTNSAMCVSSMMRAGASRMLVSFGALTMSPSAAAAGGLIINAPNETSIRLAPALIVGDAEIAEFIPKITQALEANA